MTPGNGFPKFEYKNATASTVFIFFSLLSFPPLRTRAYTDTKAHKHADVEIRQYKDNQTTHTDTFADNDSYTNAKTYLQKQTYKRLYSHLN